MNVEHNHQKIVQCAKQLHFIIADFCVEGWPKSMALTKVEEALFWATQALQSGLESFQVEQEEMVKE